MKQSHHDGGNMGFETKIKEKKRKTRLAFCAKAFFENARFSEIAL